MLIQEKILGTEHPDVANTLNNMALLYDSNGDRIKAEPLYRRSLAIKKKTLGSEHPDTAGVLNNLACLYSVVGRNVDALDLMERAQEIDRKQIEQILGFAPEAQQAQFLATLEKNFAAYLSFIHQRFPNNSKAVKNALDVWLGGCEERRRGLWAEKGLHTGGREESRYESMGSLRPRD